MRFRLLTPVRRVFGVDLLCHQWAAQHWDKSTGVGDRKPVKHYVDIADNSTWKIIPVFT